VQLAKPCAAALAIRWAYDLALYFARGDNGLLGVDSGDYLNRARLHAAELMRDGISGWLWLGIDPMQMPMFTWTTALSAMVSDPRAALVYVLFQGVIDTGICAAVYFIAREFDPRIAMPAGVAAAINPTQIVVAGMLYPDIPFRSRCSSR
jgi:hypothetical protein